MSSMSAQADRPTGATSKMRLPREEAQRLYEFLGNALETGAPTISVWTWEPPKPHRLLLGCDVEAEGAYFEICLHPTKTD